MSALRLRKLAVRAMPGFRMGEGFILDDLDHDVIVILGPNGSGKSTTARAVTHLLWPSSEGAKVAYLDGDFLQGEEPRSVTLEAGRVHWHQEGIRTEAPVVGERERASHYHLALPELFGSGSSRDLAEAVRKALSGGFDVKLAASIKGDVRKRPKNLENAVREAKRATTEAIQRDQAIRQRANELGRLHQMRTQLDEDLARARQLELDLQFQISRRRHREAWRAARAFPRILRHLHGNEVAEIESGRDRLASAEREWQELGAATESLTPHGRSALLLHPLTAAQEADLEGAVETWAKAEERMVAARSTIAESSRTALAIREALARELGHDLDDATFAQLRYLPHQALVDEFRSTLEAEGVVTALESLRKILPAPVEGKSADKALAAIHLLVDWLRQPETPVDPVPRRTLLVSAFVAGFLGLIALALRQYAVGAALLGMAAPLFAFQALGRPSPALERRDGLQREYEAEGYGSLDWSDRELVRKRLEFHRDEWTQCSLADHAQEFWTFRREQRDTAMANLATAQQKQSELGLSRDSYPAIGRLLAAMDRLSQAESEHAGAIARMELASEELSETIGRVRSLLAPFGFEVPETASAARRLIANLRTWGTATETSRRAFRRYQEQERANANSSKLHGIEDLETLRDLSRQLPAFQRAQDALGAAREGLREASHRRGSRPYPTESEESLTAALDELQSKRTERDRLTESILSIESDIRVAKGNLDVETAITQREKAREDLAEERDRQIHASVAEAFAEFVVAESEQRDLPLVFRRAQTLFSEVTRGQYRLEWSANDFLVIDQTTSRSLALEGLSSGTRVQLLLAVRLAFVQLGEAVALPLLLDETLATSDPERSSEVIRAIGELLNDGRQAFYFTTQPDEAKQWEIGLPGRVRVIRLDEVRKLSTRPELWEAAAPMREVETIPPPPKNGNYEAYRELLEVPPRLDPLKGIGSVHLWHLLDRCEDLYAALKYQRPVWGRFEKVADRFLPEDLLPRVRARATAAKHAIEAFRIGRPLQPITIDVLRQANMTDAFIRSIEQHCADLLDRPNDFYRRLQDEHPKTKIPNVLSRFRLQLAEYLETDGWVDLRPPLGPLSVEDRLVELMATEIEARQITLGEIQRLVAALPFERQADQQTLDF